MSSSMSFDYLSNLSVFETGYECIISNIKLFLIMLEKMEVNNHFGNQELLFSIQNDKLIIYNDSSYGINIIVLDSHLPFFSITKYVQDIKFIINISQFIETVRLFPYNAVIKISVNKTDLIIACYENKPNPLCLMKSSFNYTVSDKQIYDVETTNATIIKLNGFLLRDIIERIKKHDIKNFKIEISPEGLRIINSVVNILMPSGIDGSVVINLKESNISNTYDIYDFSKCIETNEEIILYIINDGPIIVKTNYNENLCGIITDIMGYQYTGISPIFVPM